MGTHRRDILRFKFTLFQQAAHNKRVLPGYGVAGQGADVQFIGAAAVESQQSRTKIGIEGLKGMALDVRLAIFVDARQHAIYTVQGCPRHQANEETGGHGRGGRKAMHQRP
jgi:hypothetical protein